MVHLVSDNVHPVCEIVYPRDEILYSGSNTVHGCELLYLGSKTVYTKGLRSLVQRMRWLVHGPSRVKIGPYRIVRVHSGKKMVHPRRELA